MVKGNVGRKTTSLARLIKAGDRSLGVAMPCLRGGRWPCLSSARRRVAVAGAAEGLRPQLRALGGTRRSLACFAAAPLSVSPSSPAQGPPSFQEAIQRLQSYWSRQSGCAIWLPHSSEVGAGTMNPATFLRVLGPEPWRICYAEPSMRPDDSRFGANPNRVQRHTQFQVILKPEPGNAQDLYLGSLEALGIPDLARQDIRFVEDDWESPVLGSWGLGWEVWLNGMEVTQFTYFQQTGGVAADPVSVEITYGLERILMAMQGVKHFKDIRYGDGPGAITYGEMFLQNEYEMSRYNMEEADVGQVRQLFEMLLGQGQDLVAKRLPIPAYEHLLKASHAFNVLDARGAVGVTERAKLFAQMRSLSRSIANLWVERREELGFPLLTKKPAPVKKPAPPPPEAGASAPLDSPATFVLELGSEELPADEVTSLVSQLGASLPGLLASSRLHYDSIECSGTPRRVYALVRGLSHRQEDIVEKVRGPPESVAFDDQGQPTKALLGFCKKNGTQSEDVTLSEDGAKGARYCFATIQVKGKSASAILSEHIPSLVEKFSFKKSMRWNESGTSTYARPLRWILAMHGPSVVPFNACGVSSSNATLGMRGVAGSSKTAAIELKDADDYMASLVDKCGILVDMEQRRRTISQAAESVAERNGGVMSEGASGSSSDLLGEVTNLVELPTAIEGSFRSEFLELPKEILVTVMKKHQRYFPVENKDTGELMPIFIAIANGEVDVASVRSGNEAVLTARFEDATFFYKSDMDKTLSDFRPLLGGIMFQNDLGTMLDKSDRVEKLSLSLSDSIGFSKEKGTGNVVDESVRTAAHLCRADLATSVVTEFTDLGGVMGKHYALKDGLSSEVAEAIYESVLPRYASDDVPKTPIGIIVSMCDRLDSLVGLVAAGCGATATSDPFGLRRIAYGVIQTVVKNGITIDLSSAIESSASLQPIEVTDQHREQALDFLCKRLEQMMVDEGHPREVVRSVLVERKRDPSLAMKTVQELSAEFQGASFARVAAAYARPTRIVAGKVDESWRVDESMFEGGEEKRLWNAYLAAKTPLRQGQPSIGEFIEASQCLEDPMEEFFEKVFVMAEDEGVKRNRLAMMRDISRLPSGILDLKSLPNF